MSELTCNDCDTPAQIRTSKSGKDFYTCPNCPSGNADYPEKFLTFASMASAYKKKKKSSPRQDCNLCEKAKEIKAKMSKRKAHESEEPLETKRLKLISDELDAQSRKISEQIAKTDILLEKIEKFLQSSSTDEETDDTTE